MATYYTNVEKIGNKILFSGYDQGNKFRKEIYYKPTLYIRTQDESAPFRGIHGEYLEPKQFDSITEQREFIKKYNSVSNFKYYGQENIIYQFISDIFPNKLEYNPDEFILNVCDWDIETASDDGFPNIAEADKQITAITLSYKKKYYVFGLKDYTPTEKDVVFTKFEDEKAMLKAFVLFWQKIDPDVITGWNIEGFDIPYTVNRIRRILNEDWVKKLSPWGIVRKKTVPTLRGEEIDTYEIYGINIADYFILYRKYGGKTLESYSLKHVAYVELGETKLDISEEQTLHRLYLDNYEKFIRYNIMDVRLLPKLEEKTGILKLALSIMYDAKTNMVDVFKNTRIWDALIYNHLKHKNIIVPQKVNSEETESIPGGFVKVPESTSYDWIISFDFTSLYPSLIRHYNIGPDTLRGKISDFDYHQIINTEQNLHQDFILKDNYSLTGNGTYYDKNKKSFVVELIEELFKKRKQNKDKMLFYQKELEEVKNKLANLDK